MSRNRVSLLVAVIAGLIAALMMRSFMSGIKGQEPGDLRYAQVTVAKKDMPKETVLEKSLIAVRKIPSDFLPSGAVLAKDHELILGQSLQVPVKAGEPILWSHVGAEARETLSSSIPKDKRALTIGVDDLTGVGGMVVPRDRVDVLITYTDSSKTGEASELITTTLLQDLQVLAVGREKAAYEPFSVSGQSSGYSSLTLSVSPLEAGLLVFAQENGKLCFTLRNPEDREKQKVPDVNFEHLKRSAE